MFGTCMINNSHCYYGSSASERDLRYIFFDRYLGIRCAKTPIPPTLEQSIIKTEYEAFHEDYTSEARIFVSSSILRSMVAFFHLLGAIDDSCAHEKTYFND